MPGQTGFRVARRFSLGTVLGCFLAGGTWVIVDMFTGSLNNNVFVI